MRYLLLSFVLLLAACGQREFSAEENRKLYKVGNPYSIGGQRYTPREDFAYDETGLASWYGPGFHRNNTANGEEFDKYALTAAHRTLPMPSMVRVTNLENGKQVTLRVNDRGPFAKGRIIDVSKKAADVLGFKNQGVAKVRVQFLPQETAALFGGNHPSGKLPGSLQTYEIAEEPIQPKKTERRATSVIAYDANAAEMKPTPASTRTSGSSMIQVGRFRLPANAKKVLKDVSRFGIANLKEIVQDKERFYIVQLGPFTDASKAERALNTILDSGYPDAYLTKR